MTDSEISEIKTPGEKRRWLRRALWASLVAVLLLLGWFIFKLATGPVRVPFVAGYIERILDTEKTSASIHAVEIDLASDMGPNVSLREADLMLKGRSPGHVYVPSLTITFDLSSIWSGAIKAHAIDLEDPHIEVTITPPEQAVTPSVPVVTEILNRIADDVDQRLSQFGVDQIQINNADLSLSGLVERSLSGLDVSLARRGNGQVDVSADINGQSGPWYLRLGSAKTANGRRILIKASELTIKELAGPQKEFPAGKGAGLPFQVIFDGDVDQDGAFSTANVVGRSLNGWLQLGRATVRYDDLAVSLLWSKDTDEVLLNELRYKIGDTDVNLSGRFSPPGSKGGEWFYRVQSNYSAIGPSDIDYPPHVVEDASIEGRFSFEDRLINFDRFLVQSGSARVQGAGSLQIGKEGPYLALAIDGEKVPVTMAQQLWPITLAPPARQWVIKHVKDGFVENASFNGSIRPPAFDRNDPDPGWGPDDLNFDLNFTGTRVAPVGDVPDAHDLSGKVQIVEGGLQVSGSGGAITIAGEVPVVVGVPRASFIIPTVRIREGKIGKLDVDLDGPVWGIGSVLNSEPFHVLDKANVTLDGVTGEGAMNIKASFGIDAKVRLADVDWQASAQSKKFSSPSPILGHTIRDADIKLEADPTKVKILGDGKLDGLQAAINLVLPLGGSSVAAQQSVGVEINAEQLKKRGVDLTEFLSGPLRLDIQNDGDDQRISVDLKKTKISINALGWTKEKGVPAKASFLLKKDGERHEVQDFSLQADGVSVLGGISLSPTGTLSTASFSKFQLRPDDDVTLSIQRTSKGLYKVAMVGNQLDARGLIRQIRAPGTQGGQGDFKKGIHVSANIDRVIGHNSERIDDFTGTVEITEASVTSAKLSGKLRGNSAFRFVLEPFSKGRTVNAQFGNSGAVLAFLDLFDRMRGGQGELDVVMASETNWTGQFNVRKLSIANDPALQRLRKRTEAQKSQSEPGKIVIHNTGNVQGGDAYFETLEIDFIRSGQTINISKGALQGAVYGGTVSGNIDLSTETMDMSGTFVPMYALNNIFAKIPILGFALGGGSSEGGLIGVTYKLSGALEDPVLTVNPVSAIAPGIFRKMFEFQ